MKFSPDSITRAIRIAQAIGSKIDPAFSTIPMFKDGEGAPLERDTSRNTQDIRLPMNYPPKEQFAKGGDVYGDNSKIKVVGNYEGEHRLVPISPKNTNYRHVMEYVPIDWLMERQGNEYRHSPERMAQLRKEIQEEGLREPVLLSTGKNSRTSIVGEGNHRVLAAHQLGYTHIPVRAMVGSSAGSDRFPEGEHDKDIIPEPNKYFPSDAKPSRVMRSLGYEGQEELPEHWWEEGYADGGEIEQGNKKAYPYDMNLYSYAAEQAPGLQRTDTPDNYKEMLAKLGVKKGEFEASGYDEAFAGQPQITREQVAAHFNENLPKIEEKGFYANEPYTDKMREAEKDYWKEFKEHQNQAGAYIEANPGKTMEDFDPGYAKGTAIRRAFDKRKEAIRDAEGAPKSAGDPYHEDYSLPGGENYREILLKHSGDEKFHSQWDHFGGEPNVLVSLRMLDRKDDDNNKVLHLEEIQSDWGQQAREIGIYNPKEHQEYLRDLEERSLPLYAKKFNFSEDTARSRLPTWKKINPDTHSKIAAMLGESDEFNKRAKEDASLREKTLLGAPYIDSTDKWLNLGLKRALIEAARGGHDKLMWTPGDLQVERYPEGTEEEVAKRLAGMTHFYDTMVPKALLKLAKQHDPEATLSTSTDASTETDKSFPALNITPKMRESILRRGFAAHADGGAVEGYAEGGDVEDHPLTNPVYHGTKSDTVSSPIASGIGMEMFDANHPALNYNAPNATALALGPHVARDPNISGDYRFTTGEQHSPNYLDSDRLPQRAQGHVALLNTFPDEKFFPVEQSFDDFTEEPKNSASRDDQAVHNTVYADVFQNNPKLTRKILKAMGKDPEHIEHYVRGFQSGEPFEDPVSANGFKWPDVKSFVNSSTIPASKNLTSEVVKDFRKRMRDKGYVGLSYINTDLDETKNAKDKKCYIVFPQRDKETGWYPMRFRHGAAYDPENKGKPGLHLATGGEADGMEGEEPQASENPNGGLMFSPDANAARLQAKMKRDALVASGARPDAGLPKNPRTVIKAPIAEEGQKQLPDFVTGNIDFEDWRNRHEQILNDDEIHHSSQWYKNIYGNFKKYYPEEADAKKMMRAWLVAQQNVSPAGAMNNVLMQQEQMDRGEPEELWRAGGMPNPTAAARSVLAKKEIKGGVGQKISDFVDSAEGKGTRSWMGDHPDGGSPFVVDVHTARDTGVVDQELINHLTRLGYDPEALSKLKVDMTTSPSEPMYENRAQFGRDLTDHLNKMGWKGRNDWTPDEIQAVGWMGMTKLTRNAEEDSESGLGRNLRRISYELAPGEGSPWEATYGKGFEALPDEDRYGITQKMADSAMEHAQKLSGINVQNLVHGTGAWENYQNPAAVTQTLSTQRGADIAAAALGHLLQQTEVWHNRVKPMSNNPKGFALDFIEKGSKNLAEPGALRDFWGKVMEADPHGIVKGYQPITLPTGEIGLRALFDRGGKKTQEQIENLLADHEKDESGNVVRENPFRAMLESHPFDMDIMGHEAEITKHRNDWKAQGNGEGYISRLVELLGYDPSAKLNSARQQLEKEFGQHLDEAHKRQGTSWREAPEKPLKLPKANGGAINKAILIAMRAKKRSPIAIR